MIKKGGLLIYVKSCVRECTNFFPLPLPPPPPLPPFYSNFLPFLFPTLPLFCHRSSLSLLSTPSLSSFVLFLIALNREIYSGRERRGGEKSSSSFSFPPSRLDYCYIAFLSTPALPPLPQGVSHLSPPLPPQDNFAFFFFPPTSTVKATSRLSDIIYFFPFSLFLIEASFAEGKEFIPSEATVPR